MIHSSSRGDYSLLQPHTAVSVLHHVRHSQHWERLIQSSVGFQHDNTYRRDVLQQSFIITRRLRVETREEQDTPGRGQKVILRLALGRVVPLVPRGGGNFVISGDCMSGRGCCSVTL